jgi:hypothetical protein
LALFQSPDFNERSQIVIFVLKYISEYPDREIKLWKSMAGTLIQYRQGYVDPFAVTPILAFFGRRFADRPPQFEELRWQIYTDAVVPLASTPHILSFNDRIEAIVRIMSAERPMTIVTFVRYLIKVFPFRRVTKQAPFIAWLEKMAESVPRSNFWLIARPLFVVYAFLAVSDSVAVVEASFKIWDNGPITPMIMDNAKIIYPIMLTALTKSARAGGKGEIQNHISSVLRVMHECHPALFEQLVHVEKGKKSLAAASVGQISEFVEISRNWASIARAAWKRDQTLQITDIMSEFGNYFQARNRYSI